jgi:hypothetical protein
LPESLSASKHPVGIVIQHGLSRTAPTRCWAYVWSMFPGPRDQPGDEPWLRRSDRPPELDGGGGPD